MKHVYLAALAALLFSGNNALSQKLDDKGAEIEEKRLVITCAPEAERHRCQTPELQLSAAWREHSRFNWTFDAPAGYTFVGPADGVVLRGRERHSVDLDRWAPHSLTCHWFTAGSNRPFGPGGYVRGYCYVYATKQ